MPRCRRASRHRVVARVPPAEDDLRLRREAGRSPKTQVQATAALPGRWAGTSAAGWATRSWLPCWSGCAEGAPAGGYVSQQADPPGRRLYERHGSPAPAPGSVAMALRPDQPGPEP